MKNCTPLWREAHFQVKMHKTHQHRTTFGSWDVEKWHAAVAGSTFKKLAVSDHFFEVGTWNNGTLLWREASKCQKTDGLGPLLEVRMWKNGTSLWREAHFQVKMLKTWGCQTIFGQIDR